jgi:hypothetical protein
VESKRESGLLKRFGCLLLVAFVLDGIGWWCWRCMGRHCRYLGNCISYRCAVSALPPGDAGERE